MSNWLIRLKITAVALVVGLSPASIAYGGEFTYSGSLQSLSGDYTLSEDTQTLILWNELAWTSGPWRLSVSLPILDQDTPFVSHVGGVTIPTGRRQGLATDGGGVPNPANGNGRGMDNRVEVPDPNTINFDQTGIGDFILRVDASLLDPGDGFLRIGVYAAVKPPLADEDRGFGTGEWDASVGMTLGRRVNSFFWLADVGVWHFGDLSDLEFEDALAYSLAVGHEVGRGHYSFVAGLHGLTEIVDGVDGPVQLSVTGNRKVGDNRSFRLTFAGGLTESAPDLAVSLGWSVGL